MHICFIRRTYTRLSSGHLDDGNATAYVILTIRLGHEGDSEFILLSNHEENSLSASVANDSPTRNRIVSRNLVGDQGIGDPSTATIANFYGDAGNVLAGTPDRGSGH